MKIDLSEVRHARTPEEQREKAYEAVQRAIDEGTLSLSELFFFMDDGGDVCLRILEDMKKNDMLDYKFHFRCPKKHRSRIETYNHPDELWIRNGLKTQVRDRKRMQDVIADHTHRRSMDRAFSRTKDPKDHKYNLFVVKEKDGVYSLGLKHAINAVVSLTGAMDDSKEDVIFEVTQAELEAEKVAAKKAKKKEVKDELQG